MPLRPQRPPIILLTPVAVAGAAILVGALLCSAPLALCSEIPVPAPVPCNCLSPEKESQLQSQLKSDIKLWGKISEQTARRQVQLAEFYARKSDLKKSEEYITQALETAHSLKHQKSAESAESAALIQRARNHLHQAQWSEAEKSAHAALTSARSKQQRADALSELAWAQAEQKQYKEAITRYEESLELRKTLKHTKDSDETIAVQRQQLAAVLQRQGSSESKKKAIDLLLQSVSDLSKSKGAKHPLTLFCEEQLAVGYLVDGQPDKAEQVMHQVLTQRTTVLGDDNPELSATLFEYASMLQAANKPKEAEAVRARALKLSQKLTHK